MADIDLTGDEHTKRYVDIASEVNSLLSECLAEIIDDHDTIRVDAIVNTFAFSRRAIAARHERIKALLSVLPSQFHRTFGGGWSFLQLPFDADGIQWGEQRDAEILFALACAAGMAKFVLPREYWKDLPGAVPYVVFDTEAPWRQKREQGT